MRRSNLTVSMFVVDGPGLHGLRLVESRGETQEPSFLGLLNARHQQDVISCGRLSNFARGTVMLYDGHAADDVIVLLAGHVKLSAQRVGRPGVILGMAAAGAALGAEAAIEHRPYTTSAHALDKVQAVVIPGYRFRSLVSAEPAITMALIRSLAAGKRAADRFYAQAASCDAVGRVAGRILELAVRLGSESRDGTHIESPLSQEELAGWIGASRQTVVRALQALRGAGWVTTSGRTIVVHDVAALERLAA